MQHWVTDKKLSTREESKSLFSFFVLFCFVFAILGFELRAYTLSHSTSPFFVKGIFKIGSLKLLPGLASNHNPPDLCLLSS
jgi:hypothetical protein